MHLDVLLFAAARQMANSDHVTIEVGDKATAADVLQALGRQHPQLDGLLPSCRLAVDCTYVDSENPITPDSEIALIPPVSGG